VFVEIESFDLAFGRVAQPEGKLDCVHQHHRRDEGGDSDREAADYLRLQNTEAAAVK